MPHPSLLTGAAEGLSPRSWEPLAATVHPGTCRVQAWWGGTAALPRVVALRWLTLTTAGSRLPGVCIKLPQPGAQTYYVSNP